MHDPRKIGQTGAIRGRCHQIQGGKTVVRVWSFRENPIGKGRVICEYIAKYDDVDRGTLVNHRNYKVCRRAVSKIKIVI